MTQINATKDYFYDFQKFLSTTFRLLNGLRLLTFHVGVKALELFKEASQQRCSDFLPHQTRRP